MPVIPLVTGARRGRRSFATLLDAGYDIRKFQELPGHGNVSTT